MSPTTNSSSSSSSLKKKRNNKNSRESSGDDDASNDDDNVFEDSTRSFKHDSTPSPPPQSHSKKKKLTWKMSQERRCDDDDDDNNDQALPPSSSCCCRQTDSKTNKRVAAKKPAVTSSVAAERCIPKQVVLSWKSVVIRKENKSLMKRAVSAAMCCCCSSRSRSSKESILQDVGGIVMPGEILAIMGPSGSGKTSLLNALSFSTNRPLKVYGRIMLNGCDADATRMAMVSRYIQQEDLFFGTLTVKEHLTFHAMLRLDKSISRDEKMQRVEKVLKELNLEKQANVKIGIPGRIKGISGGEKRRLSFASEILTDPPLLFCDEPTSGLDSFMAKSIVYYLQKMSQSGKTIICSIHQPSSDIFNTFDKVCLLAQSRVAYFGSRENALEFFSVKLKKEFPRFTNPADFYMNVLGLDVNDRENSKSEIIKYCDEFAQSEYNSVLTDQIDNVRAEYFSAPVNYTRYKSSWSEQLSFLIDRSFKNYIRNHIVVMTDIFMVLVTAILGGLIYFRTSTRDDDGFCYIEQEGIINISFALFYTVTSSVLYSIMAAVLAFPLEIPIYNREHDAAVYRADTYYISKLINEVPVYIILPTIHAVILYFLVGFTCYSQSFFVFLFTNILVSNSAYSLGHILSALANDVNLAVSLMPAAIAVQMLFSGFFLNKTLRTPKFLIYIKYSSVFNYAYDLLMANQWERAPNITCEAEIQLPPLCFENGQQILEDSKIDRATLREMYSNQEFLNSGMLVALAIGYRLIAFLILWFKGYRKSHGVERAPPRVVGKSQPSIKSSSQLDV